MFVMSVSQATTMSYDFNLPATSTNSQTPPYVSVATLTLVDSATVGEYVEFTLDPNELNSGYTNNENTSNINDLNIAYHGADLAYTAYVSVSGPAANAKTFGNANDPLVAVSYPPNNKLNLDTNYSVPLAEDNGQLKLTWDNLFVVGDISVWRILNTSIDTNFSLMATSSGTHPTPTFGILSIAAFSLAGENNASSSNWVTGPAVVPVPAAAWLFGTALFGFFAASRRKKIS